MRSINCKLMSIAILFASVATAQAAIIFSNDFQSDTNGFSPSGSISSLGRVSLPTDSGGLGSANQSMWLGRLGSGVAKRGSIDEIVTLNLSSLIAGQQYSVAFDLLVGGSWDGSASGFGPDSWRFAVNGTRLVDTTFTNGNRFQEYGAFSPQKYSDTTYTSTSGPDFGKFTGADFSFTTGGNAYSLHYAIYRFGRGAGNPVLTFTASGTSAMLEFARYGNTIDSADEYWALDNVQVSGPASGVVPEPASVSIWGLGILGCAVVAYGKKKRAKVIAIREKLPFGASDGDVLAAGELFKSKIGSAARGRPTYRSLSNGFRLALSPSGYSEPGARDLAEPCGVGK